ncbi:MAG: hypothetical protein ACI4JS_09415 [Oscillospiraceae bacterium]
MDLRDFATGLVFLNKNTKRNQTEAAKSLWRLFEKTARATPLEGTVRKWITSSENSKRNCDVRSYYPEPVLEKGKKQELYMYIRRFGEESVFRCQKEFKKIITENNDKDYVIDIETENFDILCFSILNQFIILMGMEGLQIDDPDLNIDPKIVEIFKQQQIHKDEKHKLSSIKKTKRKLDKEAAEIECERIALEKEVPKENKRIAAEENDRKMRERIEAERIANPQSTLAVPPEYCICRFCKFWESDCDNDITNMSPIIGHCTQHNFESTSITPKCDKFSPNYSKMTRSILEKMVL